MIDRIREAAHCLSVFEAYDRHGQISDRTYPSPADEARLHRMVAPLSAESIAYALTVRGGRNGEKERADDWAMSLAAPFLARALLAVAT